MAEEPNSKYQSKEVCAERLKNIETMFSSLKDDLVDIKQALPATRDLARNNKTRLDTLEKARERSWQSGWKLTATIVGAVGGIQGLIKLLEHLAKP
jgi:hypothetical protein